MKADAFIRYLSGIHVIQNVVLAIYILFSISLPASAHAENGLREPSFLQSSQTNARYLSSIKTTNEAPARISVDQRGLIYATSPLQGKIHIFSPDGILVSSISGLQKPLSVAVDAFQRIYVGDMQDKKVSVLNAKGKLLFHLGKGEGEFSLPGDIAIAANGFSYVTDSSHHIVKVYDKDGAFKFSFGGYGNAAGQFNFPTGIATDDINQEIYVVDHNNGRIEVFDFLGVFKRSLASLGAGEGKLTRPQGIWFSHGKVFVADTFQSNIEVFDGKGNFIEFIGKFGSDPGDLKVPTDVAISGKKLYIANSNNERIEVYSLPSLSLPGDVDGSGAVGLEDAIIVLQALTGIVPARPPQSAADVNGDSLIWLPEAIYAIQCAAGVRHCE